MNKRKPVGYYTDDDGKVRPITKGRGRTKVLTARQPSRYSMNKLRQVHARRSEHAQKIDESIEADTKDQPERWMSKTNRSDITGVDYYPMPLSNTDKLKTPEGMRTLNKEEAELFLKIQDRMKDTNFARKYGYMRVDWYTDMDIDIDREAKIKGGKDSKTLKSLKRKGYVEIEKGGYVRPTAKVKSFDNYKINVDLYSRAYEDHFNTDLKDLKFKKTTAKGYKAAAYYRGDTHTIYFSKPIHKILSSGKIKSAYDFKKFETLTHEIGHGIHGKRGEMAGYRRGGYRNTTRWLDEGSNSISSIRFCLHNIQIDRNLRKEILKNPDTVYKYYSYKPYMEGTADLALLINKGDERKAVQWIDNLRTTPNHNKYVRDSVANIPKDDRPWIPALNFGQPDSYERQLKERNIQPTSERVGRDRYWYLIE
jgi:hypothetical protein